MLLCLFVCGDGSRFEPAWPIGEDANLNDDGILDLSWRAWLRPDDGCEAEHCELLFLD
jgi:hypothetical protein